MNSLKEDNFDEHRRQHDQIFDEETLYQVASSSAAWVRASARGCGKWAKAGEGRMLIYGTQALHYEYLFVAGLI